MDLRRFRPLGALCWVLLLAQPTFATRMHAVRLSCAIQRMRNQTHTSRSGCHATHRFRSAASSSLLRPKLLSCIVHGTLQAATRARSRVVRMAQRWVCIARGQLRDAECIAPPGSIELPTHRVQHDQHVVGESMPTHRLGATARRVCLVTTLCCAIVYSTASYSRVRDVLAGLHGRERRRLAGRRTPSSQSTSQSDPSILGGVFLIDKMSSFVK